MNKNTERAVNIIISNLAEDRYVSDERCDSDIYGNIWEQCIEFAIDDFKKDVKGYLDAYDIFVTEKEANDIYYWALDNVNTKTIRRYTENVQ